MRRRLSSSLTWLRGQWSSASQAERYLWLSIFVFALGWAVTVHSGVQTQVWDILTSFGTLAAAIAALSAAATTRDELRRQIANEREAKLPNLILSNGHIDISLKDGYHEHGGYLGPYVYFWCSASNISQYSINIYRVIFDSPTQAAKGVPLPVGAYTNQLVAPSETQVARAETRQFFFAGQGGEVIVFFHYGATGQVLHALRWKFRREASHREEPRLPGDYKFATWQEYVEPENARKVYKGLLIRHVAGTDEKKG